MNNNEERQAHEAFFRSMTRGPIFWINEDAFRRGIVRIALFLLIVLPAIKARNILDVTLATFAAISFGLLEFNLGFIAGHLFLHSAKSEEQPTYIMTLKGGEKHGKQTNERTAADGRGSKRSSGSKRQRGTRPLDNNEPGTRNTD